MFSQLAVVTACCCYALLVLAPSYSCALLALTPCYCLSLLLARLASITLCLLSHLVVSRLVIVPCRFHTLLLCLATFYYHALLLSHLAILTPCCLTIVAPPSRVTTLPWRLAVHHFQVPPSPPHYYFVALLVVLVPYYFALSIGTPSSLSYASGGAWSNTNKLHPITKVFFSLISWVFFFLLCILFVYHFFFELNKFFLM